MARYWIAELAVAVGYLHSQGIMHRSATSLTLAVHVTEDLLGTLNHSTSCSTPAATLTLQTLAAPLISSRIRNAVVPVALCSTWPQKCS